MQVTLIGLGCGSEQLTAESLAALRGAELIIGAARMLSALPAHTAETAALYLPQDILNTILASKAEHICVLYSGDTGFYSGARLLVPLLEQESIPYTVLPAISSLQALAARLGEPWQEWKLCSAHGTDCDILSAMMSGRPCFFLTGGKNTPQALCRALAEAGLGTLPVHIGENISGADERITACTASEAAEREFSPLSVLLTHAAPIYPLSAPGIPDEEFLRDKVPMTKREIRAAALSALRLRPDDVCWDIGAGTGSVSIELALHSRGCWAVECKPEALALAVRNRERFRAWNLRLISAKAPEGLDALPAPDAVFIGGSSGQMDEILAAVHTANPRARICITAIALETLSAAIEGLRRIGYTPSVTQIAVSRTKEAGSLHLLMAQNPVFLITGELL